MSSQIVSSQTMPSETEVRSNRSDEALALEEDARLRTDIRLLGRFSNRARARFDSHPPARAHPRRYRARPGGRRRVRPGRAHPADLDPVPSRRGQAGAAGTRNHPRQHVDQRHRADRPRLQLFLASRQHRRGPEQHPPDARPWPPAGRGRARSPRPCRMREDGRLQRRRSAPLLREGPGQPGADRASDRSSPQEHDRPRDGDRGAARPPRTRRSSRRKRSRPATSSCAARC